MMPLRPLCAAVGLGTALMTVSPADAQQPIIRARIAETGPVLPGQQIHLVLDVLAPGYFSTPPQFPLFALPNALVTQPQERSQNVTETISGVQFSGIEKRYSIIPQISGDYQIPPITVTFSYGGNGQNSQAAVTSPPLSFSVAAAPDASPALVAASVDLKETYDPTPERLKVGDALVRTVTVSAEGILALTMPAVSFGTAHGLTSYLKPPRLDDNVVVDRRTMSQRTETIVYTATTEGLFAIPAVSYPWLNATTGETATASLPPVTGDVAPVTAGQAQTTPPSHSPWRLHSLVLPVLALLAFAAFCGAFYRLWPQLRSQWQHLAQQYQASPRYARSQTVRTLARGSPAEIYAALRRWSARAGYPTLSAWAAAAGDRVEDQITVLEQLLFSSETDDGSDEIDRDILIAAVRRRKPPPASTDQSALAALNPPG
jgi:hypothetical protein